MPDNKRGPRSKTSEAGKRFETAVRNWGGSLKAFYVELSQSLGGTSPKTIEDKISKFINGHEDFPGKYIYDTEHILNIRIADIIDGTSSLPSGRRGLYEIGTQGKYQDFEWLAKQTDGSVEVIKSYDEWSNSIFDYVYEAGNLDGLRFLVDNGFYETFGPGHFMAYSYHKGNDEEHALILLNMLANDEDPEARMFTKIFDSREHTDLARLDSGLFGSEAILRKMLKSERLLEAVARKPELVNESVLNGPKRVTPKEYQAVCASNWLTPLLCFALAHENEYLKEAMFLAKRSWAIAKEALASIGKNIALLGGPEESISTKDGHIILGHTYVIGVIGEPKTDEVIKDSDLKNLVDEITSVIGSFRSLAKIQTPVKVNGKLHMPRADQNKVYRVFITASKGHKFLLQESESNDRDSHNYVFDAPQGKESRHGLSLKQWRQVGKALRSIHGIETGEDGKSFCHGRFCYPDIYVTDDGDIELIAGYHNVYIGNPEEDVFSMATLAFKNNFVTVQTNQDSIDAFLEGYGYPKEGFLEKLWEYLVSLARNEDNMHEARYLMECAVGVLQVIKANE